MKLPNMMRCRVEEVAKKFAEERGQHYGHSVFEGGWWVGTKEELSKIGVVVVGDVAEIKAQPGLPKDSLALHARMRRLIEDAFAANLSTEQVQDLFWRNYLAFCKIPYKELTAEEVHAAHAASAVSTKGE